jgi:HD superfamily phosphohydrolase
VSGQLDMDRLDYLRRDSFFTGVAEGVIGHDRIIAMLNIKDDEIVVEEKGLYSIEKFLVARRLMYLQVYLHKAVISAEQMIRQLITELRRRHTKESLIELPSVLSILLSHESMTTWSSEHEMLDTFARIDDVEIDYTLKSLLTAEDPVLQLLSRGLIHRRLFRTQFHNHPVTDEEIQRNVASVSAHFHLDPSKASALVLTGMESVPTYDPAQGDIRILRKDGSTIPLPGLLTDHSSLQKYMRYFISMPKEVGERN